jgi:hypothetical protein
MFEITCTESKGTQDNAVRPRCAESGHGVLSYSAIRQQKCSTSARRSVEHPARFRNTTWCPRVEPLAFHPKLGSQERDHRQTLKMRSEPTNRRIEPGRKPRTSPVAGNEVEYALRF